MKTLVFVLSFVFFIPMLKSQPSTYYGGRYEGEGTSIGFKIAFDFKNGKMLDTVYFASSLIHNYSLTHPDNPADWQPVFAAINPDPIHVLNFRFVQDSVYFETDKHVFEGGDWRHFAFSGMRHKKTLTGMIKQKFCSSYDTSKVYTDNRQTTLIQANR